MRIVCAGVSRGADAPVVTHVMSISTRRHMLAAAFGFCAGVLPIGTGCGVDLAKTLGDLLGFKLSGASLDKRHNLVDHLPVCGSACRLEPDMQTLR
jgi:hypothetical protein